MFGWMPTYNNKKQCWWNYNTSQIQSWDNVASTDEVFLEVKNGDAVLTRLWDENHWYLTNSVPVQAFDPNATLVQTNWLGTNLRVRTTADGLPEDPELRFVVSGSVTNWYRLENTAFPLFATAPSDGLNNPKGVFGSDGESVLAVADSGARRVRLYEVGLDALDSEEILAMAVRWPTDDETWHGLAARDLGEESLIASDIIQYLPKAFLKVKK